MFEGCDRSGKTTQVSRLFERFNSAGKLTVVMKFPDRETSTGKVINSYLTNEKDLDDRVVHLLFSANRWELEQKIVETLMSGKNVFIDRYAYSGVAFSAAKPGLDINWCKQPDVGLPKPDLVCFLDVSEEVASARADFGDERYEKKDFQRKVRVNYETLKDGSWVTVSADGTPAEVENELFKIVAKEIEKSKSGIDKLWSDC